MRNDQIFKRQKGENPTRNLQPKLFCSLHSGQTSGGSRNFNQFFAPERSELRKDKRAKAAEKNAPLFAHKTIKLRL
jgi:hypothetical protein